MYYLKDSFHLFIQLWIDSFIVDNFALIISNVIKLVCIIYHRRISGIIQKFPAFRVLNSATVKWDACNISSVMEFQRWWWVLKSKVFGQELTYSKQVFLKSFNELQFIKKCQNCTFEVNIRCQKSVKFFQKKII